MLRIRIIKKYYSQDKGLLIGYRVRNIDTGEEVDASKEAVKAMAIRGELEIENMTLTSDGRLIGHAGEKRKPKAKPLEDLSKLRRINIIFTNGKKKACALIDETEIYKHRGIEPVKKYARLEGGFTFDTSLEVTRNIEIGKYANVKIIDNKVEFEGVKKSTFSKVEPKLKLTLQDNDVHFTLSVKKAKDKYGYLVTIDNLEEIKTKPEMLKIVYILIENSMYNAAIKVEGFEGGSVVINCMTGINDVRKALKDAGIVKF